MTKKIDFSKPIEARWAGTFSWESARVLGPVFYCNPSFTHAIAIKVGGSERVYAASEAGVVEGSWHIRNVLPKVVEETWVNLYGNGFAGATHENKQIADAQLDCTSGERYGYYVTKTYDDGSRTNEVILIESEDNA